MKARERIYIVPHWAGIVLGAAVFAIFGFGYLFHGFGGLPQVLVISLVVAGIAALFQTNENLHGLMLVSCRSRPVPAGGETEFAVTLANLSTHEQTGLQVRTRAGWKLSHGPRIPLLKPGERRTVRLLLPAPRRGRYPNPDIWVASTFPLGLCFAWKNFSGTGNRFVYPQPSGRTLAEVLQGGGGEGIRAVQKGMEDIKDHRPYVAGDPLSRINWKIFAKSSRLVVKTPEGTGGDKIRLRWEDTAFLDDPEARLSQLSLWVSECLADMRPFELQLGALPGHLHERNPDACRIALAIFQP